MATYLQMYNLLADGSLLAKTTIAVMSAATAVVNESAGTANHAKRLLWAQYALANPQDEAKRFMWGIVSNATIAAAGSNAVDSDVQFVVNSYVDSMSLRF